MGKSKEPFLSRLGAGVSKVGACAFQLVFFSCVLVFWVGSCVKDGKKFLSCTGITKPAKEESVAVRSISKENENDQRFAKALVKMAKAASLDLDKLRVAIIETKHINAATVGKDTFLFCEGLGKLSSEQLNAVMAHEVAHAVKDHSAKSSQLAGTVGRIVDVTGGLLSDDPEAVDEVRSWATSVVFAPFSREQELEADRIGVELLRKAGYPQDAVRLMCDTLGSIAKEEPEASSGGFLATHPAIPDRIDALRKSYRDFEGVLSKPEYWLAFTTIMYDAGFPDMPAKTIEDQIREEGEARTLAMVAKEAEAYVGAASHCEVRLGQLRPPSEYAERHAGWVRFIKQIKPLYMRQLGAAQSGDVKATIQAQEEIGKLQFINYPLVKEADDESKKYLKE